jgi:hypothetical protein
MDAYIFWDITACSLLKINRRSGGICLFHLHVSACYLRHDGFLLCLFLLPENGGDMFLGNVGFLSTYYAPLNPRR